METKIKIFNQLENREGLPSPVGDGTEPVFDYVRDEETGDVVYKEVGRSNLYDIIQASKEGTDIHIIIEKMEKGLLNIPSFEEGLFCDVSDLPRDVHEAGDMVKTVKSIYEKDPLLKELYPTVEDYTKAFVEGRVLDAYSKLAQEKMNALKGVEKVVPEDKNEVSGTEGVK